MLKKILRKSFQILPFIFLGLTVLLIIQVLVAIKNDQTPTILGYSMLIVVSPSMEDTIMTGDLIFVNTKATSFEVGDIITFHKPDNLSTLITHRIIEINDVDGVLLYTTMGDNNFESLDFEKNFTGEYIVGKFVSKTTALGKVYQFIYKGGINLIYGAVVLIFVTIGITEVSTIIKEVTKSRKEIQQKEKDELVQSELEKLKKELDKPYNIENEDK